VSGLLDDRIVSDPPTTLPHCLARLARERPHAVALREKRLGIWEETTWQAYLSRVAAVAHKLWDLGVRPGEHVAIISDNRPEWLYADLAAQALGARSVGIYQTNPKTEVCYVLQHCAATVLICEDQEQVDKVVAVAAQTPRLRHIVVIDPRGTRAYTDPRLLSWASLLADGQALHRTDPGFLVRRLAELDPRQPAIVVYTSGTTGQPKGAMLSSANVVALGQAAASATGARTCDSILSYLPLCHVAEKIFSLFVPLHTGAVVHFGESIETVRQDLVEVSPTIFLGVPRIWEKMRMQVVLRMQDSSWLERKLFEVFSNHGQRVARQREAAAQSPIGLQSHGARLSLADRALGWIGDLLIYRPLQERLGLRRCVLPISGAAPISADLIRWFHGLGIPIAEGYGQTECSGVSHLNPSRHNRIGTVGQPLEGVTCRIGEDGVVLLRGPSVFSGYLHDAQGTADTVSPDGWLATGDLGTLDDDGFLRIIGRKKEIIVTAGGKNLSPERIENALKMSPYVKEAVAVGDWATRRGLAYAAFADLAGKAQIVDFIAEQIQRSNELLAPVEQVRGFRLLHKELHQDDGELTATQKVRRNAVQQGYSALIESIYRG
jgi:long-chain acyl-CoA synthetase